MDTINLIILGSKNFEVILNELEFNNILKSGNQSIHYNKRASVKIIFAENLKIKDVKTKY